MTPRTKTCPECEGYGYVMIPRDWGAASSEYRQDCTYCLGAGEVPIEPPENEEDDQ